MATGEFKGLKGYRLVRELGVGGQARVYLAEQQSFERKVAIKILLPSVAEDAAFTARFLREAKIVANLSHPHIIPVYDFGEINNTFYMVMEYVGGGSLNEWIKSGIVVEEALRIISQLALALNFAHEKGVVHRDVKPDNVMFREDGSAVLMDFGIARGQDADNQVTRVGQVLGTPTYMSPEQLQGRKIDGRSDIYSLGIMFYQMLVKKAPYVGKDFMTLAMMHTNHPIPKLPAQYIKFQKIFEKMVAKDPERRFRTGLEVSKLFQDILSGKTDPLSVVSSAAADLESAVTAIPEGVANDTAAAGIKHLPREQVNFLQDLHPLLDTDWEPRLLNILQQLDVDKRRYVYANLLNPKGIYLDKDTKQFFYSGTRSVSELKHRLQGRGIRLLAIKIEKIIQTLQVTREIMDFAALAETSLDLLNEFDCQDNVNDLKEKSTLKNALLNDLISIVRGTEFEIPDNKRKLTAESIASYILHVFIRQQIMGYRFRKEYINDLEHDENAFIRKIVAVQARIRQCDVVRAGKYLFMIGPAPEDSQNQYSIRRFIQEEAIMRNQIVYFNSVVVPLNELKTKEQQTKVAWEISRIVNLERQLSPGVSDAVSAMEQARKGMLLPILLRPLEADGSRIEAAIEARLLEYEKELTLSVLAKLTHGVMELAKTPDDFYYLYDRARDILISLASDVRDFTTQSSTSWSQKAEEMDLKMVSYLRLFDKRKESIFLPPNAASQDPLLDPSLPLEEFKRVVNEYTPRLEKLNEKLRKAIIKQSKKKNALLNWAERLFLRWHTPVTPESVQQELDIANHKCLVSLIKICKRFNQVSVYLEHEDLKTVDETKRHYALPAGIRGISQLPKLIILPEERSAFNLNAVESALLFDALRKKQAKALRLKD